MGLITGHGGSDLDDENNNPVISSPQSHGHGISLHRKPIPGTASEKHQYSQVNQQDLSSAVDNDPKAPLSTTTPIDPAKTQTANHEGHFWLSEIIALVICVAAFASAICILALYQGESITRWKSDTISLNTVLSVLATISRASLAFVVSGCIAQGKWNWFGKVKDQLIHFDRLDDASKGLYGSFRLLWSAKKRP